MIKRWGTILVPLMFFERVQLWAGAWQSNVSGTVPTSFHTDDLAEGHNKQSKEEPLHTSERKAF